MAQVSALTRRLQMVVSDPNRCTHVVREVLIFQNPEEFVRLESEYGETLTVYERRSNRSRVS